MAEASLESKGAAGRPSPANAFADSVGALTNDLPPFDGEEISTVVLDSTVGSSVLCRASISGLNIPRCPPAILRKVAQAVVDSIKGMSLWSIADISDECLKGLAPFWTNRNAASAVVFVSRSFGIFASLDHKRPNAINRCSSHAMRLFSLGSGLFLKTPARLLPTALKINRPCFGCLATNTLANPLAGLLVGSALKADRRQSSKNMTLDIREAHGFSCLDVVHGRMESVLWQS